MTDEKLVSHRGSAIDALLSKDDAVVIVERCKVLGDGGGGKPTGGVRSSMIMFFTPIESYVYEERTLRVE